MAPKLNGGKTPPRLVEDLKLYNPHSLPLDNFNVLTELPAPFDPTGIEQKKISKHGCKHTWVVKQNQCSATMVDGVSASGVGQVAAFCTKCLCHLTAHIDCSEGHTGARPCPQQDAPLHHFVYQAQSSPGYKVPDYSTLEHWEDLREFRCSISTCMARLFIRTSSPRLKHGWKELLINQDLIQQRADKAMSVDPQRFEGHPVPAAWDVLSFLKQYIANAIKGDTRRINASNKKWLLSLGQPCSEMLNYLGFTRNNDEWTPPLPPPNASKPYDNNTSIVLDDALAELNALQRRISTEPGRPQRPLVEQEPRSAIKELQMMLSCKDYETSAASRTIDLTDEEHPFYTGLGTTIDFHDNLISYAYDQQLLSDPSNQYYYLECLQGIAMGRSSMDLQTKMSIEASLGRLSMTDIRDAFRELGLTMDDYLTDDHIIGTYKARVADVGKQQEISLKGALGVIGQHRNSEAIQQYASDTITTYEQALDWLGATKEMDESFITSMYGVKLNENISNEAMARKCVEKIAEHRGSTALRAWLSTGQLDQITMDAPQAYARLNIENKQVDDEMVLAAFRSGLHDVENAPSQIADLHKALSAIAEERDSSYLRQHVNNVDDPTNGEQSLNNWPVGLENIGNTCYLNSLLQYYFSIKPLREIVMDFERYKMEVLPGAIKEKRVGSRSISEVEVKRAQEFVTELKTLFHNMITANTRQITPERQLARLTILSSSHEESIARRFSTVSNVRPDIKDIAPKGSEDTPDSNGVESRDQQMLDMDEAIVMSPIENGEAQVKEETPSTEGTLVDAPRLHTPDENDFMVIEPKEKEEQAKVFENKENLSPTKSEPRRPSTADGTLRPLGETSPSRVNEQNQQVQADQLVNTETTDGGTTDTAPPQPSRPPPIPPRANEDPGKVIMQQTEDYARQQDVTEVIGNVLFQLSCAMRAKGIDKDGEQLDEIKDLFFGKMKITTTDTNGKSRTKEEFFSDIKINVHNGPQDIYAAIDASLDKQMVTVGTSEEPQYTTISQLPPVLQIYSNRIGFDRTRGPYKVIHHLDFPDVIYMDRYLDSDNEDLNSRRRECWEWKESLHKVEEQRGELQKSPFDNLEAADALELVSKYLDEVEVAEDDNANAVKSDSSTSLSNKVTAAASAARSQLTALNAESHMLRERINSQFADFKSVPYRLHSVFIHRGLVSSGHYWIYIFDFEAKIWRKYNDGYVTAVSDPKKEIFSTENGERPSTPMFLVYVKDGEEGDLVEALKRVVPEAEPELPTSDIQAWPTAGADHMHGVQQTTTTAAQGQSGDEKLGEFVSNGGWGEWNDSGTAGTADWVRDQQSSGMKWAGQ